MCCKPWLEIPITNDWYNPKGNTTLVDLEDYELVREEKWGITGWGYVGRYASATEKADGWGKVILLSRYLVNCNAKDTNTTVDHINRDIFDNRKCNLRIATRSQNSMNRPRPKKASSKYKGVFFCKQTGRWKAAIMKDKKSIWIGRFDTEEAAALAYNKYANEIFGTFAFLNKVTGT